MASELSTPAKQQMLDELLQYDLVKQSEAQYRLLVQALPAALYTTDHEGYITLYNPAAVELWGREPITGNDRWCGSWKIYTPDGQPLALEESPTARTLNARKPVDGHEIMIERPDGTRRHVMPYPRPIFDASGKLVGVVNMLVDISEIKRSSEERYHKMVEEVEDYAILLMDRNGVIQNWNRGAEKIKGYKEEEIVGKSFRVFYLPEDQERGLPDQLISEAILQGKALHEGWRVRKDGSVFWGSIVITALHDANNNIVGFSKVTRDLTERKIAEDKIRQYTNELEFQNRELEQFAYAAAHDMKEPLRKIRFYINMVFDNWGAQLPEKERDYLQRSISAAARMQTLIDDLLTYSKTSAQEQEFKKVDLGQVIAEIQLAHYDTIRDTKAEIKTGNLPIIHGIQFQLMQLFDNLLGNALKYRHPERQSRITVSSEIVTAQEAGSDLAEEGQSYYKITVADNGIGFDSRYAVKVFDLFQRLHDKITYTGTGIGLTLCRKIVQNHRGFILARAKEGTGASFMVYFPVENPDQ